MNVVENIMDLWEKRNDEPRRTHLGASQIGASCERSVQLNYRWAFKPMFKGRMHRLFQVGYSFEDRVVAEMKAVGYTVKAVDEAGEQFRLGDPAGLCGSCDGFIELQDGWHVLECKTHNQKSFDKLKDGVKISKPQHYAQVQTYMGYSGLQKAFYLAENKNTSDLYEEVIEFDQAEFDKVQRRASRVMTSNELLPQIAGASDTFFECKWCDAFALCHKARIPDLNCRTCMNWSSGKDCGKCQDHEHHIYHPMFTPWEPVDGNADYVKYDNGIANCTQDGFPAIKGDLTAVFTSKEMLACGSFNNVEKMAIAKNELGGTIVTE